MIHATQIAGAAVRALGGPVGLLMLTAGLALAQSATPVGQFDGQTDVGNVQRPGSATYKKDSQSYTIEGSGTNMWGSHDEFHFVWKRLTGDFILQTNAVLLGKGVDPHRKFGWMVRTSLDSSSAHINAAVHGDGLTSLQFRRTANGPTEESRAVVTAADVVQLARKGNTYTMSVARNGDPFVTTQVTDIALGDGVYVGLFVCSHNKDVSEQAEFHNVRVIVPIKDSAVPYKEYIGSNLELMDVATGRREVIYQATGSIQAPNWTPDNKALIYNSSGLLYRFDLVKRTPILLNTEPVTNNNNDHALSFGGKMLAISASSPASDNKSVIYTVPVSGGKPKQVTPAGHSYFHGWSADNKTLAFTGERNGDYDVYTVPAAGGPEKRLTTTPGLDDGPEYSPDGKYIYFNSVRSGLMQIWRMKPDGSGQEQITSDEFNNWFPHVSPDGKSIVILSFGQDVKPNDHPFYKQVLLRLMPIVNGKPDPTKLRVLAYVYGGQGTINTPSWSPDSKRIAFISNTDQITTAAAIGK